MQPRPTKLRRGASAGGGRTHPGRVSHRGPDHAAEHGSGPRHRPWATDRALAAGAYGLSDPGPRRQLLVRPACRNPVGRSGGWSCRRGRRRIGHLETRSCRGLGIASASHAAEGGAARPPCRSTAAWRSGSRGDVWPYRSGARQEHHCSSRPDGEESTGCPAPHEVTPGQVLDGR